MDEKVSTTSEHGQSLGEQESKLELFGDGVDLEDVSVVQLIKVAAFTSRQQAGKIERQCQPGDAGELREIQHGKHACVQIVQCVKEILGLEGADECRIGGQLLQVIQQFGRSAVKDGTVGVDGEVPKLENEIGKRRVVDHHRHVGRQTFEIGGLGLGELQWVGGGVQR